MLTNGIAAPRALLALDLRRVRLESSRADEILAVVTVPQACELDDLGYAIVWAIAGFNDALLADDYALEERHRQLRIQQMPILRRQPGRSRPDAGGPDVARLQLLRGHILRNLSGPAASPVFWDA